MILTELHYIYIYYVSLVLHVIASLREEDPTELAEKIWNNTNSVFFPNETTTTTTNTNSA